MEKEIMFLQKEENPFEDPVVAKLWITSVENEKGEFREKDIYPRLQAWLDDPVLRKVLDIGAGQGAAAPLCRGRAYVGIEPAEVLVQRAREQLENVGEFLVGNAYQLPFADASFNGAFSINVWFHLANLDIAAQEMARVLCQGGKFLIITANPEAYSTWESFYEEIIQEGKKFSGKVRIPHATLPKSIFYKHTENEITRAFKQAGLTLIESTPFAPIKGTGPKLFRAYSGTK